MGAFRIERPNPLQVPTQPVEVDWSHPLADGLVALYIPGNTFCDLAVKNGTLAPGGTSGGADSISSSARGPGFATTGSYLVAAANPVVQQSALTVAWFGNLNSQPANDTTFIGLVPGTSYPPPSPYTNYQLYYVSFSTALGIGLNLDGTFTDFPSSLAWDSVHSSFITTFNLPAGGGSIDFYGDGIFSSSTSTTNALQFMSGSYFWVGADSRATNAFTAAGSVHIGALSPDLIQWLNAEPFAMLRLAKRRRYYAASSSFLLTLAAGMRPFGAAIATATGSTLAADPVAKPAVTAISNTVSDTLAAVGAASPTTAAISNTVSDILAVAATTRQALAAIATTSSGQASMALAAEMRAMFAEVGTATSATASAAAIERQLSSQIAAALGLDVEITPRVPPFLASIETSTFGYAAMQVTARVAQIIASITGVQFFTRNRGRTAVIREGKRSVNV